jgi:hypothetical protein
VHRGDVAASEFWGDSTPLLNPQPLTQPAPSAIPNPSSHAPPGCLLLGLSSSFPLMLMARIITGSGFQIALFRAYFADTTSKEKVSGWMRKGVATGTGSPWRGLAGQVQGEVHRRHTLKRKDARPGRRGVWATQAAGGGGGLGRAGGCRRRGQQNDAGSAGCGWVRRGLRAG